MSKIIERYTRAAHTSNLRSKRSDEQSPDADLIFAAGAADSLGTMLMRLRSEFDTQNALELKNADRLTARAFTLMSIPSLTPTRQALGAHAVREAARRLPTAKTAEVFVIVGQVLDRWLDPLCSPCDGRGVLGAFGEPQLRCTACRGSGHRKELDFGTGEDQNRFGQWLGAEMDRKVTAAAAKISEKTRET